MQCNKVYVVKSVDDVMIELLMPEDNLISHVHADLGVDSPVPVKLTSNELKDCAKFLSTGKFPEDVDSLIINLKYLQCISAPENLPREFFLIKLKEDWLRGNLTNPLVKLSVNQGVTELTNSSLWEYPKAKIDSNKILTPLKTVSSNFDVDKISSQLGQIMTRFGLGAGNTADQGVVLAGGSGFCAMQDSVPIKDYDIFFYGYSEDEAMAIIDNVIQLPGVTSVKRTSFTITFHVLRIPYQFVLRLYDNISQILLGFDIDCCRVAFDGQRVWATESALFALKNKVNVVDFDRMSPTYEMRLAKYATRGISVYVPELDRHMVRYDRLCKVVRPKGVNPYNGSAGRELEEDEVHPRSLRGLSNLIYRLSYVPDDRTNSLIQTTNEPDTYGENTENSDDEEVKYSVGDEIEFGDLVFTVGISTATVVQLDGPNNLFIQLQIHSRSKKTIAVTVYGPCDLEFLIAVSGNCNADFPAEIQFRKIDPGAQTAGSFNPVTYANTKDWYMGFLYNNE